jgi:uncharacterized protein DUF5996
MHEGWPELPYAAWKDTYATLHLWSQVVGKVALAQAPPLNHAWGSALQLTARGLSTRLLPYGERAFTIEFDLIAHELVIRTTDGHVRVLPLIPKPVAEFEREMLDTLAALGLPVKIWPVAVELPEPIRLDQDFQDHAYDREYVERFWRIIVNCHRVLSAARAEFIGKASPVHFFWGSFDLACTRFSGRPGPPREGPAFMREAYSHEVISHGWWPGSGPVLEPAFYGYAVPEPAGLKEAHVEPGEAYYHRELGEFILPYEAVRKAADPERALTAFIQSTYERAATLGNWDRAALERSASLEQRSTRQ